MGTRVLIAIPSGDFVHADFMVCLAQLIAYQIPGVQISLYNSKSCHIDRNRYHAVEAAKKVEASYLLFLDSDMIFPHDLLERLLEHRVMVVATDACKRTDDYQQVAKAVSGLPLPRNQGLVEAGFLGTGLMLIDMEVFGWIEKPYFVNIFKPDGLFTSADYYFSKAVRDTGEKIYCDTDIRVGHVGQKVFYTKGPEDPYDDMCQH